MKMPEELLTQMWEEMDWKKCEAVLAGLQRQLTLAAYARDREQIFQLQKRIVRSTEAKALAVRHVAGGKSGPGVDGVRWTTPAQKMEAALSLTSKDYHAQPMRLIIMHSKVTGQERRVGVPTYFDRAMQVLYDYSLLPVTEAWADRKSFAFRPGRSMQDVNAYILEALKGNDAPEYVVIGDVKACYASIQHRWLMANAPMDHNVLKEFLNCGHVFAGELFPADETGISLGANLSPRLGNFVLDGMQRFIHKHIHGEWTKENPPDWKNGDLIRFADDLFITVRTPEDGAKALEGLALFLEQRGLMLSPEKTSLQNINDGITFLSRTYTKKDGIVHVEPSKAAVERFSAELRETIMTHKKSQRNLIETLNHKLRGWATYHRYSEATTAFRKIDADVQAYLLAAATKRHPKMNQKKLIAKYWYELPSGEHVYALPNQKEIRVMRLMDVMQVNHRRAFTDKNPFLDDWYFEEREHSQAIHNVTGPFKAIWERQGGRCYYCGRPIMKDQPRTVVQLRVDRDLSYNNSVYVHKLCQPCQLTVRYVSDDVDTMTPYDIMELLTELADKKERPAGARKKHDIGPTWKHIKLKRYFASQKRASITLSFEDIEKIDERALPKSARNNATYWYPRDDCNMIAEAWISEGYTAKRIDVKKEKISFKRVRESTGHVTIPLWLEGKVPDDARLEIENFLNFIKNKYRL